ncbi:MAG: FG-GAP repeat domain-containing protein [Solirubrobacterales bacterium]
MSAVVAAARLEVLGAASAPKGRVSGAYPTPSGLFEPYANYTTGSVPQAVAVGDVTGDGLNDVLLTTSFYFDAINDYKLFVFRQLPDGTLAAPIRLVTMGTYANRPESVTIADVNGDARNDVLIGNSGAAIGVFYQNMSGGLEPVVLHATPDSKCVRVADLNDDGRSDIVGLGWGTSTVSVLLQQVDGTLASPAVYWAPHSGYDDLEVGDLNHDGLTDVIAMSGQLSATPNVSVLYQSPSGTLGGLTSRSVGVPFQLTHGIGIGDVNTDGRNDIVASYGSYDLALFLQSSDGTLGVLPVTLPSSAGAGIPPRAVEVADVDGDGRDDVLVLHTGSALSVYQQRAGGAFGPEELDGIPHAGHVNPHGLAIGDINHDGWPDVVIANEDNGLVVLRHVPMTPRGYYPVPPCRVLDTRVVEGPIQANTERTFTAAGSCGVPADAGAVAINVTAVNAGDLGDLRLYPAGAPMPLSSTINFDTGRTRANNAVISLGTGGGISVRCDMSIVSTASVHMVVDVYGYFR